MQNSFRLISLLFTLFWATNIILAQKKKQFIGLLEYKITPHDTNNKLIQEINQMFIYTNDTITRTVNFTKTFGKQVTIKHMEKQKSYLLLTTYLGKFAIQNNHNMNDSIKNNTEFIFKKKWRRQKIINKKANKILVFHPEFKTPIEFLYLKKISNKYLNIYNEIAGLPVKYSVPTEYGILDYELVSFSEYSPNKDLFGIPSDFQKISIDEFLDTMIRSKKEEPY